MAPPALYVYLWTCYTEESDQNQPNVDWNLVERALVEDPSVAGYSDDIHGGKFLLHFVCALRPSSEILQQVMAAHPVALRTPSNVCRFTPFMIAADSNAAPLVMRLLHQADPHAFERVDLCGRAVIHLACRQGVDHNMVKVLLQLDPRQAHVARSARGGPRAIRRHDWDVAFASLGDFVSKSLVVVIITVCHVGSQSVAQGDLPLVGLALRVHQHALRGRLLDLACRSGCRLSSFDCGRGRRPLRSKLCWCTRYLWQFALALCRAIDCAPASSSRQGTAGLFSRGSLSRLARLAAVASSRDGGHEMEGRHPRDLPSV